MMSAKSGAGRNIMRTMRCLLLALGAFVAAACQPKETNNVSPASTVPEPKPGETAEASSEPGPAAAESIETEAAGEPVTDLSSALNSFTADLYGELKSKEGNLFLSPYSISAALTMTAAGARGETRDQMASVLGFGDSLGSAHTAQGEALERLQGSPGVELSIANSLWGQAGLNFERDFTELLQEHYGAGMRETNFQSEPEQSRTAINAWVEEQTRERIQDLIPEGAINNQTRLVLANAIYFKGKWDQPFDPEATRPGPFKLSGGGEVQAPFMYQKAYFAYQAADDVEVLELPYDENALSMVIVLPKETDGLAAIESKLSAEQIGLWTAEMRKLELEAYIPKFKMTSQFSLAEVLSAMGMPLAFSNGADFSGMTQDERLAISAVLHKAFVDVNEEGTEAAAATGAVMTRTSMPTRQIIFRADHPFLFFIRERSSGAVLFMGRVANPV